MYALLQSSEMSNLRPKRQNTLLKEPLEALLDFMRYSVVDIETTGGSATWHRITEIAIYLLQDGNIIDSFQSLINPKIPIPANISMLTGITDAMVANAPYFEDVADRIESITDSAVFVAHSVNFDFGFIKAEFDRIGRSFQRKKLCTVRLARKIFPGHRSYSLGSICADKGIFIAHRHRAGGDAEATVKLFLQMLSTGGSLEVVNQMLNRNSKEANLPPHISKQTFELLPDTTGIYLFHDQKGKVIYVGKAAKIKSRVYEHFSGNTHTKSRQMFISNIYDVSFEETGSELMALLLENELIKKHYPRYNRSNKNFDLNTGIYVYEDRNGFKRASVAPVGKRDSPSLLCKTKSEAIEKLLKKTKEYDLCLRLMGILPSQTTCPDNHENDVCYKVCHSNESPKSYNKRFESAFKTEINEQNYILKTKGRNSEEAGFVIVQSAKILGFGFVANSEISIPDIEYLKSIARPCYDTKDSQSILNKLNSSSEVYKFIFK